MTERTYVYVLQDNVCGTYTVLSDRDAVDVFFERYDRKHYTLSREPVITSEALNQESKNLEELVRMTEND